jgi:hypothetical protein
MLDRPDAATPAARRGVGALGNHQRVVLGQAAGQPFDLLSEDGLAGLAVLDEHIRQPVVPGDIPAAGPIGVESQHDFYLG